MLVFFSYAHADRAIAAEAAKFFRDLSIDTFMAHEDINVSAQWVDTILEQLAAADIFLAILTQRYLSSIYCIQESGIAVARRHELTIMPLRIDDTLPPGFMSHFQARQFVAGAENDEVMFDGLAHRHVAYAIDLLVNRLGMASTFRNAERKFALVQKYLGQATDSQKVDILRAAAGNTQFGGAYGVRAGLMSLLDDHADSLSEAERTTLNGFFSE